MVKKLFDAIGIRSGEERIVGLVLAYAIVAYSANALVYTAAFALFLSEYSAGLLPYVYIGVSICTTLITLLYLELGKRYTLAHMLMGKWGFLLVGILGYAAGLALAPHPGLLFTLPIWHGILNTLMFTTFWNLLGRLFNLQQAKRLFGLFNTGQPLAIMLTGLVTPVLIAWLGTAPLLWVALVAGGGAVLILWRIVQAAPPLRMPPETQQAAPAAHPRAHQPIFANTYVRLMVLTLFSFVLTLFFVDNIFYSQVEELFPSAGELATFLSRLNILVGLLSLLSQVFLANRLLSRFGVRVVILLTPLLLLFSAIPFVVIGAVTDWLPVLVGLAVVMSVTRQVMDASDNTASNLLYQPMPAALRTRTQTALDGIVSPVAAGMTGLLLLWLINGQHLSAVALAAVLVPILGLWIGASVVLGRHYQRQVKEALQKRFLTGTAQLHPEQTSLGLVRQSLLDPHPGVVIYALDVLESIDTAENVRSLCQVQTHPNYHVRLESLSRLERLRAIEALPTVAHTLATDGDSAVRHAAVRTLATIGGLRALEQAGSHFHSSDPEVRRHVLVGLLRSRDAAGVQVARQRVEALAASPVIAERIFAAQVLRQCANSDLHAILLALLADSNRAVQLAAVEATGRVHHPHLWAIIVPLLGHPALRAAARAALAAGDRSVLPPLAAAFASLPGALTGDGILFQRELVRLCGRLRSAEAIPWLLPLVHSADAELRSDTLRALDLCGYRPQGSERGQVEQGIRLEIAHMTWGLAALVDLAVAPEAKPVCQALDEIMLRQQERIFLWLALVTEPATVVQVRDALGLRSGMRRARSDEQKSYALEMTEMLVAKPLARLLLPLLDEMEPALKLSRLAADFPQPRLAPAERLLTILEDSAGRASSWLQAISLYCLAALALTADERQRVERVAQDYLPQNGGAVEPLLAETAIWLLQQLGSLPHAEITLG